ncbi:acyl carrier protein [Salmonella enterica]
MARESLNAEKLAQVANIIYQVNGTLAQDIEADQSLVTDLAMDSVEMVDLLMRLEEYGVVLNESQISSRLTVGQIAEMLPG